MNILPKKRWHVRTKDNIARVRRDEAKAAEEEKQRERRIQLAEQEARTSSLRKRAKLQHGESIDTTDPVLQVSLPHGAPDVLSVNSAMTPKTEDADDHAPRHLNFFPESADGLKNWTVNKEHEEEKKQEQEKYEKSIGLLTYLGQASLENKEKPWYYKAPEERNRGIDTKSIDELKNKSKSFLDPLSDMRAYMKMLKEKSTDGEKEEKSRRTKESAAASHRKINSLRKCKSSKKSKSHKRHKHKRGRVESSSSSSSSSLRNEDDTVDSKHQMLEKLRADRLHRERCESLKAEKLMAKLQGGTEESAKKSDSIIIGSVAHQDCEQRYNSQFNPHLAKKRKPHL